MEWTPLSPSPAAPGRSAAAPTRARPATGRRSAPEARVWLARLCLLVYLGLILSFPSAFGGSAESSGRMRVAMLQNAEGFLSWLTAVAWTELLQFLRFLPISFLAVLSLPPR